MKMENTVLRKMYKAFWSYFSVKMGCKQVCGIMPSLDALANLNLPK